MLGVLAAATAFSCLVGLTGAAIATDKSAPDPSGQAAVSADAKELIIMEESDGKTVSAIVGQKIIIRIPSVGAGPKPPPQWTAKLKGKSLKQQGEILLRAKTIPGLNGIVGMQQGGPMTTEAVFTAIAAGKTTITLEARPRGQPKADPSKTFTVTVDVKKVGRNAK